MTSDSVPAGGDPRRLLAEARDLARRVRLAQRVTWLPLLVLAVVTFGAIPAELLGRADERGCQPVDGVLVCKVWYPVEQIYWLVALAIGYALIARVYLRVARGRGVDARVLPYVIAGVAIAVLLFAAIAAGVGAWILPDVQARTSAPPSDLVQFLFRLLAPTGGIGVALLMLAWLERHATLLLFTLVYLAVVLAPVDFGWTELSQWQFVPMLVIGGVVLLLGSAGFALAQQPQQARPAFAQRLRRTP